MGKVLDCSTIFLFTWETCIRSKRENFTFFFLLKASLRDIGKKIIHSSYFCTNLRCATLEPFTNMLADVKRNVVIAMKCILNRKKKSYFRYIKSLICFSLLTLPSSTDVSKRSVSIVRFKKFSHL